MRRWLRLLCAAWLTGAPVAAHEADVPAPAAAAAERTRPLAHLESVCLMVEAAARAEGLPVEFFARVIWQESRFQADAVGPLTRSGGRALGIAQFMPGTAAERGLADPFDPVQALPKSAEFLRELWGQFGNLGLAAAAYNAGPRRVREWLAGTGPMPRETRNYVLAVTGRTVEDWAAPPPADPPKAPAGAFGCSDFAALVRRAPTAFFDRLEARVARAVARPWGVQLAAGFSRERVLGAYATAIRRFERVLAGRDPTLLAAVLRSRGTRAFYQARVGTDTRAQADALCDQLRKAGGACLVLRNRGAVAAAPPAR